MAVYSLRGDSSLLSMVVRHTTSSTSIATDDSFNAGSAPLISEYVHLCAESARGNAVHDHIVTCAA